LAHGANKNKSIEGTKKLKTFLKELVVNFELPRKRKLRWLDQTIDGKAGQGWADFHGCYIVYIWPPKAN
jgi:hypothetical protein